MTKKKKIGLEYNASKHELVCGDCHHKFERNDSCNCWCHALLKEREQKE